jgi:hypothetical protein
VIGLVPGKGLTVVVPKGELPALTPPQPTVEQRLADIERRLALLERGDRWPGLDHGTGPG